MRSGFGHRQSEPFALAAQIAYVAVQQFLEQPDLLGIHGLAVTDAKPFGMRGLKLLHAAVRVGADAQFARSIVVTERGDDIKELGFHPCI